MNLYLKKKNKLLKLLTLGNTYLAKPFSNLTVE